MFVHHAANRESGRNFSISNISTVIANTHILNLYTLNIYIRGVLYEVNRFCDLDYYGYLGLS